MKALDLCILLIEHPHGSGIIDLDVILVDTSELLEKIVDESLGWFLVRVENDALVRKTNQLDVLHLEDVAVGRGPGEQRWMSTII